MYREASPWQLAGLRDASMNFEWDKNKRRSNIVKHEFDFLDIGQLFSGDHIKVKAKPDLGGEQRFLAIGCIYGICATVIYTERNGATRIISLRKARKNEQQRHQTIYNG